MVVTARRCSLCWAVAWWRHDGFPPRLTCAACPVQVPGRILLAQDTVGRVAASTGINHPLVKPTGRRLPSLYQPGACGVCDLDTCAHCLERELSAGLAEVVNQIRADLRTPPSSTGSRRNPAPCSASEPAALAHAVKRSCEIGSWWWARTNANWPACDPYFWHTFGHAIEAGLGWRRVASWRTAAGQVAWLWRCAHARAAGLVDASLWCGARFDVEWRPICRSSRRCSTPKTTPVVTALMRASTRRREGGETGLSWSHHWAPRRCVAHWTPCARRHRRILRAASPRRSIKACGLWSLG